MKALIKITLLYLLSFLFFTAAANLLLYYGNKKSDNSKNIIMNRILHELSLDEYISDYTDVLKEKYLTLFDKKNYPQKIAYVSISDVNQTDLNSQDTSIQKYYFPFQNTTGAITGFIVFEYNNTMYRKMLIILNLFLVVSFLFILIFTLYVNKNILKPFADLQNYPQKLSLGQSVEKLPESKNRYFGKYIWAMNMLSDVLENEHKKFNRLIKDRQTLTSVFAHGIKTPISNIKLYSNAIQTGLYSRNINPMDVEIAGKIEKNADDIQQLVTSILNASATSLFEYEVNNSSFFMAEIKDFILAEYDNKFKMKMIPYSVEQFENPILHSDKAGLCRILMQLIDNAIKYGDGTGIKITLERQSEKFYFSVINNGSGLSASEITYMFNCFWRGSNASMTEGQGIGLYEAKQIAKKLGGDLFVNNMEKQVEVLLMI